MKQSILNKFVLSYLIFAILGFILLNFISPELIFRKMVEDQADNLNTSAISVAKTFKDCQSFENINLYKDTLEDYCNALPGDADLWVSDTDGGIYYSTNDESIPDIVTSVDLDIFDSSYFYINKKSHYYDASDLFVYEKITNSDKELLGYVFIHSSTAILLQNTVQINEIFYTIYYIIFFTSFIFLFVFMLCVYLPIQNIRRATVEFAKGNFGYDKLKIKSQDEMGELADSLNYMAQHLNDSEEYQHRFISNISHDFRSPLTSIKGYIQAIMDGTIPPELHNKYLGVVLSEANRLETLTNGLLDLNKWDSNEVTLKKENFDLNDLIVGVIQTFEGRCNKHEITVTYNKGKYKVYADKAKIQQIIYNITDNAIKFSPHGSSIDISVYSKGDCFYCSIKDHGVGISKENIDKIWDRFYKTDSSRGKDKSGSGIGLSIVKEIINAHQQTIDVISTEGAGTEFIFSLEKAHKNA